MHKSLLKLTSLAFLVAALPFATASSQEKPSAPTAPVAKTDQVVVFAAASLKNAFDAVGEAWTKETGKALTFSYAASSAIAKQIEDGAPADIFVSADLQWMDYLEAKHRIAKDTRKSLLGNTLVLIAPTETSVEMHLLNEMTLKTALADGKLAMGEPNTVPAGKYAKAALQSLGAWDAIATQVAGAENVRAALAYVARREAPLGIVYATDAKSEPKVKVIYTFPESAHPPIVYPAAMTSTSNSEDAKAFLAFLSAKTASDIFTAQGFKVLK